jgi:hypothetical protein
MLGAFAASFTSPSIFSLTASLFPAARREMIPEVRGGETNWNPLTAFTNREHKAKDETWTIVLLLLKKKWQ